MLTSRQKDILEILKVKNSVSVYELSKTLFVTEMTIRRDLIEMEKGGFLRRYRGGAVLKINVGEMPISQRLLLYKEEKEALASRCKPFLHDDITVFIDSSSTCQFILQHLSELSKVTVVTNSVSSLLMASKLHIPTILIGGDYYEQDMCMVGPLAEQYTSNLNVDVAFLTTAGISNEGIISDFDLKQTSVRKIVMKNAKQNVFLFEADKIGKKFLYTLCNAKEVTKVITLNNNF
ncbi:MAG: DeoR/GlpR transcriptional regulator [Clostridia bacterium]|nr:DeoR/GlpR transcriptional regulator [Clostridia bacterium]